MKYFLSLVLILASLGTQANLIQKGKFIQKDNAYPMVKLTTTMGDIVIELDRRKAPLTVNNFLGYVVEGGYEDTVFHRVEYDAEQERDFVIQGPKEHGVPGLVNLFGIESPGMTSSLAIADFVETII